MSVTCTLEKPDADRKIIRSWNYVRIKNAGVRCPLNQSMRFRGFTNGVL